VTNGLKIINKKAHLLDEKSLKLTTLKALELHTYMIAKSISYNYKSLFSYVIFVYKKGSRVLNIAMKDSY